MSTQQRIQSIIDRAIRECRDLTGDEKELLEELQENNAGSMRAAALNRASDVLGEITREASDILALDIHPAEIVNCLIELAAYITTGTVAPEDSEAAALADDLRKVTADLTDLREDLHRILDEHCPPPGTPYREMWNKVHDALKEGVPF